MCDGCASRMLGGFTQDEKVLVPNMFQFLVVSAHLVPNNKSPQFLSFLDLLANIIKDTHVQQYLQNINTTKTPSEIIREAQRLFNHYYGFYTKTIEYFLAYLDDIKTWSVPCWSLIHWVALRVDQDLFFKFITLLSDIIPCEKCQKHTKEYLITNPLTDDLFHWSVKFHSSSKESPFPSDIEYQQYLNYYKALPLKNN